jgi:phospholipid/cholesterol/gamma-HCH transport system substrate-binding protein
LHGQLAIPEPTAVVMLQTQRFLFAPGVEVDGFSDAQWSDALPLLLQAKLLQSFENFDIARAPSRDGGDADHRLLIDLRTFRLGGVLNDVVAEISFSAKIVDKSGHVVTARIFNGSTKIDRLDPAGAATAFNETFANVARDLVTWTAASL